MGRSWRGDLWLLLIIAGPNVVSTIAQTLMSIVDFSVVSGLPNASQAQAAVTGGSLAFITIFAGLLGAMLCVTTMVSQSMGAGKNRDCAAYAWQGIWFSMLFGMAALALLPAIPIYFRWAGHEQAVLEIETRYTQIRLWSVGIAGATVALDNFFNGIHRPAVSTVSVILANVLNAVISYGLVLGKWGLPQMGVEGAAWGSLIATVFRGVWLLLIMCYGRTAAPYEPRNAWRWDRAKMVRLLKVGWPSGLSFQLDISAWAIFLTVLVARFGTAHMAASGTTFRFLEMSFMPAVGIGSAIATVVGKAVGQGRPDLARRMTWLGTGLNTSYMLFMAALYVLFGAEMMDIFSNDAEVIRIGSEILILAAVFQLFDAFAISHSCALRGAGDTLWPSLVAAIEAWLILILGGTWIVHAHPELKSKGLWLFATAFIVTVGITLWSRWWFGRWEKLDVIGKDQPAFSHAEAGVTESGIAEAGVAPDWSVHLDTLDQASSPGDASDQPDRTATPS
jgi:MATE family multidrug resistance protein